MKTERRGRPVGSVTVNIPVQEQPTKFTRKFKDLKTGITSVWTFDLSKSTKGPISTEFEYPKDYISEGVMEENLPKSQRKYLNPANGKLVGYCRAMSLGLIK